MTTLKSFLLLLCIGFSLQAYAQEKVTTREVLSLDLSSELLHKVVIKISSY